MRLFAVAALVAAPALAAAHDFWVEPSPDGFLVRYGHRGAEVLAIDAAKVKAIRRRRSGSRSPARPSPSFTTAATGR